MTHFYPSYITTNRLGIYVFQWRIPKHVCTQSPDSIKLFRRSLKTRHRGTAIELARRWWVAIDQLQSNYADNPATFIASIKDLTTTEVDHLLAEPPATSRALHAELVREMNQLKALLSEMKTTTATALLGTSHLSSKPLSELADVYFIEKRSNWTAKTIVTNEKAQRPKIELLVEVVGDLLSDLLTPAHIVQFKSVMLQLPKNRNKGRYAAMPIDQLIRLDLPASKKCSPETIKNYFQTISSFLEWCHRNSYCSSNLNKSIQGVIKNPNAAHEQRDTFNDDDLKRLFESHQYLNGTHEKASRYFIPLLGLFTGARENELCQLYTDDVYQHSDTGIWVLDINANSDDKRLKKATHARLVPIHPQIIKLGFLHHVGLMKQRGKQRVFWDLRLKRDGYAQTFSRWFNDTYRNRRNCNIGQAASEKKNFHSFRHTAVTQLGNIHEIPQHKIAHLVGHIPSDGSVTTSRYIKPNDLEDRSKIIDLLDYPSIDFNSVIPWGDRTLK